MIMRFFIDENISLHITCGSYLTDESICSRICVEDKKGYKKNENKKRTSGKSKIKTK